MAESFTCVILKGLPPYVNSRNIYRFFENYLLRDLCIVIDSSLNCNGEAYVHFASHKDAEEAINTLSGSFIDNYRIFIGMCSVGILKQAKRTYGLQNIEREIILKIPQKPGFMNWNPFYKPKPVEVVKPEEVPDEPTYASPIDRPAFNSPEVNSKGYSNMCGVKLCSDGKDMKSFKIPKVKKTVVATEEKEESKVDEVKVSEISQPQLNSSSDDLEELVPASKKNRRYRKIRPIIESDSESDSISDDNPPSQPDSEDLSQVACTKIKSRKVNAFKKSNFKDKMKVAAVENKKIKKKKNQHESPRRGRSQAETIPVSKIDAEQKITRHSHVDMVEHEVTVVTPIAERIIVNLEDHDTTSCKVVCPKRGKRKRGQQSTYNSTQHVCSTDEGITKDSELVDSSSLPTQDSKYTLEYADCQSKAIAEAIPVEQKESFMVVEDNLKEIVNDSSASSIGELREATSESDLAKTTSESSLAKATEYKSDSCISKFSESATPISASSESTSENTIAELTETKSDSSSGTLMLGKSVDPSSIDELGLKSETSMSTFIESEAESSIATHATHSKSETSIRTVADSIGESSNSKTIECSTGTFRDSKSETFSSAVIESKPTYSNSEVTITKATSNNLVSETVNEVVGSRTEKSEIEPKGDESNDGGTDMSTNDIVKSSKLNSVADTVSDPTSPLKQDLLNTSQTNSNITDRISSVSSEKSVFDKDDDFDLPDLTQIMPSISNDFGLYDGDIADLSDLNKGQYVAEDKDESQSQPSDRTDIDNINEISDQLVKSANEFTLNKSMELYGDPTITSTIDSDEENNFSETVDAIVDSLSETVKDQIPKSDVPTTAAADDFNGQEKSSDSAQLQETGSENIQPSHKDEIRTTTTDVPKENNRFNDFLLLDESPIKEVPKIISDSSKHFEADLSQEKLKVSKIILKKNATEPTECFSKVVNELVVGKIDAETLEVPKILPKIVRKGTDIKIFETSSQNLDTKRTTRSGKNLLGQLEPSESPLVPLRSPTLLLKDISVDMDGKAEMVIEISDDETKLPTEGVQCNVSDKNSSASVELSQTHARNRKKAKRGKRFVQKQKKKITRASLAVPEIKSTLPLKDTEEAEGKLDTVKEISDDELNLNESIKFNVVDDESGDNCSTPLEVPQTPTTTRKKAKRGKRFVPRQRKKITRASLAAAEIKSTSPLKDAAGLEGKLDTSVEISDVDSNFDNESTQCSIVDDDSSVSEESRLSNKSPHSSLILTPTKKKPQRNVRKAVGQKKRITRGSMVVPEIKESLLWDDGGVVDLFLCDQCDYVGKQKVFHLVNFHSEREIPCIFRREDFGPVVRDPVGPPDANENSECLDINWIPAQMTFDEEIECQENDCDYYSSIRFDFIYHLLEHNPQSINSFFHCRLCNYMTNELIMFYDHVTSHTGEYRHTCVRCGQRFFSMDALKLHHNEHHKDQSEEFVSGEPIFEDGWPYIYVCKVCQYAQISKEKSEEHLQNKHNGKADAKKANMTRQITIWREKKKETEIKINPNILLSQSEDIKQLVMPIQQGTATLDKLNSNSVDLVTSKQIKAEVPVECNSAVHIKTEADISPAMPSPSITCDQSVFFGNTEDPVLDLNLPSAIAVNLKIKKPTERPTFVLDDILKKIVDDKEVNKSCNEDSSSSPARIPQDKTLLIDHNHTTICHFSHPKNDGVVATIISPTKSYPTVSSPTKQTTVPTDSPVMLGLNRSLSKETDFPSPSSDYDSDRLIIDEDKSADGIYENLPSPDACQKHAISVSEESQAKFMRTSAGSRVPMQNPTVGDNNQDGFLRIESCVTLDPKTASKVFNDSGTKQSSFDSVIPVVSPDAKRQLQSDVAGHSSSTDSSSNGEIASKIPGAELLHSSGPTVPLFQLFCKYQLSKIFFLYTSKLASKVFKCMTFGCSFTSDEAKTFEDHLHDHSIPQLRCCYCLSCEGSYSGLIQHVLLEHSRCELQCRYCLYRAHSGVYIGVHLKKFHPERESRFMKVNTIRTVPPPCPPIENFVYPYKCTYATCTFKTVDSDCFNTHVKTHGAMELLNCYMCSVVTPASQLVEHMTIHMLNEFQCPYCLFGVDERERLLTHLLNQHPGRQGRVLLRKQEPGPALFEPCKTEEGLLARKQSTDSDSSSLPAIHPCSSVPSSPPMPSPTRSISDNISLDDTGLTGHMLYRCGNEKCNQSCPTQALLKEHLHICDFSRDSPMLKCFHCYKIFRHMSGLLDHIKVHGAKRYSCGAKGCDYRGPLPHYFKNHMKNIHHSSSYKIVSKDFTNKNPETQEFIVYPKDVVTHAKEPHKKRKNEYAVEDIDKIPRSHVYLSDMKCYHCPYTSKIRLNLIKHLKLHKRLPTLTNITTEGESVPVKQPVNPVPRLDRKELMFDQMKNLAGSSFDGSKMIEANELRMKYPIQEEELADIPVHVAEETINKCGIDGCQYISCGEVMLKYHINTLHANSESWLCPHCPNFRLTVDKISPHFKMHGPKLYRCGWCSYLSIKQSVVDRHMKEKHIGKTPFSFTLRTTDVEDTKEEEANEIKEPVMQWQCGLCTFRSLTQQEMVNHTTLKHELKSQYKCGYCNVRSSVKTAFDSHFASKHPNKDFRVLCIFYRLDSDDIVPVDPSGKSVGHEPLWKRNDPDRPKQIRGIFIDDKSDKELSVLDIEPGEPMKNEFVCPKCHSFKTPCINIFRLHLCKEANYQRFECADCGITSPLLTTVRRHYTKIHGNEFTNDCYLNLPLESHLEAWVESIISYQEHKIRLWVDGSEDVKRPQASSSRPSNDVPHTEPGTSGKVLHNSGSKFVCNVCGLECRTSAGLKSHTTAMHQAKFKCQYCPFSSNLEVAVLQHCSTKHPAWKKEAVDSSVEATDASQRKKLIQKSKTRKTHPCPHCNAVLSNYKLFVRHKKQHSVRQFVCQYCKKRFKNKSDGVSHTTKQHVGKIPRISIDFEMASKTSQEPLCDESPLEPVEQIPPASEYSCCHCSETGSAQTIQEHMKVNHRELPYLVRRKTNAGMHLEVYRFTCGHCNLESVTLVEAMNHWLKIHVALDFAFKVTIFSSSLIATPQNTQEKESVNKGVKRKLSRNTVDSQLQSPKRKARTTRILKKESLEFKAEQDSSANQVSSSTTETVVDMVVKCGYCPLTFQDNAATVKHIKKVHGENKPIKMQMIEKDEYEKSHKGMFECNHCGETGAIDEIHAHTIAAHPELVASFKKMSKATASSQRTFVCTRCGHRVKSIRAVQDHIMKKHPGHGSPEEDFYVASAESSEQPKPSEPEVAEPPKQTEYRCGYCNDTVGSMSELKEHNAFLHSHLPLKLHGNESNLKLCAAGESNRLQIVGQKNTARKSFGTKRQYATKSSSGRLQLVAQEEFIEDPLSTAEVYMDYAEMDES